MRKVNYILAGLAGLFLASCSNEDAPENNVGSNDGKASYIAVKIANPTVSRAPEAGYEYGTGLEAEVKSIVFYLFDENGAAFPLRDDTDPNRDFNKVQTVDENGDPTVPDADPDGAAGDIENVYNPTLSIKHEKGEIPAFIVAVINADLGDKVPNIDALRNMIDAKYGDSESPFVMSNAMTLGGELTKITEENLAETVELAKEHPVRINVERVLAKVRTTLTNPNAPNNNEPTTWLLDVTAEGTETGTPVYAKLEGWDVTNIATNTHLIKNVDGFTATAPWPGWSAEYRSFWANTEGVTVEKYKTPYKDFPVIPAAGWSTRYLMENTNSKQATTIMVKATLVDEAGDPLTIAIWNGLQYAHLDENLTDLKKAMLVSLKGQNRLPWVITSGNIKSEMRPEDFTFKVNPDKKWQSLPELVEGVTLYKTSDATEPMTDEEVKTLFGTLGSAMIWSNGHTYYHTTIKHSVDGASDELTGVVRNHIYYVNVTDVQGLGTPVYDPEQVYDPEDPEYTESSLYAEVRILSFRLVNNDVVLGGE